MKIPDSRYLPVGPLLKAAGGPQNLARAMGKHFNTVHRWKDSGRLPVLQADEAAVALGCHPIEVWGDRWLEVSDTNPDGGR